MISVATAIVKTLVSGGVDTVFGLPGGENVHLMEALRSHDVRFVLARNESSAVYMAAAYARLTGRPGVCLTTLGPGVVHAAAGLGHAFLDREPVVYLAAAFDEALRPGHTHQFVDQLALVTPISKMAQTITPDNAYEATANALHLCQNGRPGPVYLQVSRRVAGEPASPTNGVEPRVENPMENQMENPAPDPERIAAAARHLSRAKKPLLVVGLGLEPSRPYAELLTLAEQLGAPVIMTPKAKGAIPADHPLAAGTIGLTRTDPVYDIVAQSDCVVAIGFDVVELVRPWDEAAEVIWVAPWPNIDPVLPAAVELVGSLPQILGDLSRAILPFGDRWGKGAVAVLRQRLAERPLPEPAYGLMRPQTVLEAIRAALIPGTPVTTDVGSHKILAALEWPSQQPNRYLLSNGLSCMGYGLPAAIGASLALDGEPVVAIHGDGGLAMVAGELGVVAELKLPIIVVVMNDNALDLIRAAQQRAGLRPFGTTFAGPDWTAVAAGFGISGVRVTTFEACRQALLDAVESRTAMVIEAMIDPVSYPTTSPAQR